MPESTRKLLSTGHGLLEGPIWHPQYGLCVADADRGGVWSLSERGLDLVRVAHRRGIGGMALHACGDVIVSGRNLALRSLADPEAPARSLMEPDPARDLVAFNDLTTDARGCVYAGTVPFKSMHDVPQESPPKGMLHFIDLKGRISVVASGIRLTNGVGLSPDGARLYCCDSVPRVVNAYDVAADGSLGPAEALIAGADGMPDGLAVSTDGDIWVAQVHAGLVIRYRANGRERERFSFDEPFVTSLCFGGADLRDLYVVTGPANSARGGCVYRLRVDAAGVPRAPARIPMPDA